VDDATTLTWKQVSTHHIKSIKAFPGFFHAGAAICTLYLPFSCMLGDRLVSSRPAAAPASGSPCLLIIDRPAQHHDNKEPPQHHCICCIS
jgi:hypothetical protein